MAGFVAVGAILGAVSYELSDDKTYDVWTHSVGIGLDFGIIGFLLVVIRSILRKLFEKKEKGTSSAPRSLGEEKAM
jgi:hypothetical protein